MREVTKRLYGSMPWYLGLLLFVATILAMEGVAYVAHRWVMHGPGWFLHASHHRPRDRAIGSSTISMR